MITCKLKGDFKKTNSFLEKCLEFIKLGKLDEWGKFGVEQLAANTPVNTGLLASSWYYEIKRSRNVTRLIFNNNDIEGGLNVAILLAHGHGTKRGVYISGIDYLSVPMQRTMIHIANSMRKEIELL
jgi:hypothetical protein